MIDWRTIRTCLLAADPAWEPSTNNEPNPKWDFAKALIEAHYSSLKSHCAHCKREAMPWHFYRCWDCEAYLCKECIKAHAPNHQPHPIHMQKVRDLALEDAAQLAEKEGFRLLANSIRAIPK